MKFSEYAYFFMKIPNTKFILNNCNDKQTWNICGATVGQAYFKRYTVIL